MKVYTHTYEAGGCSPEGTTPVLYATRPTDVYEYDEVNEWDVPDGATYAWAVMVRTARCCGVDSVVEAVMATREAAEAAAAIYRRAHPRAPLCDSEWDQYGEDGWADAPQSAWAVQLPIE